MNKTIGIILLSILVIGLMIVPYQITTKAQETFTKPLLIIKKNDQDLYNTGYEGSILANVHVDVVDNTALNYSALKNYKVIYLSSSLRDVNDINWDWFKGNLTAGQVVILKDVVATNGLIKIASASLSYSYMSLPNSKVVVNGSEDVVGWIAGKEFYDNYLETIVYYYINLTASTIGLPYQVVAYVTNDTYTFPALIYIEDNGVKYFFITLKYYSYMAIFLEYHLMFLYAGDGFAIGGNPSPFMVVTHIHDYMYNTTNIDGLIDFVNKTRVPVVWTITPNENKEWNKEAIDRLKQLGWLNKYVYIGVHGYYHDDYSLKTYEEILSNISAAVNMIKSYYGVNPTLEWGTPSWFNNENITKALAVLGFYAEVEYYNWEPYKSLDWREYHGRPWNNTQLHLFKVLYKIDPTAPDTPTDPRYERIITYIVLLELVWRSFGYVDTIYFHTFNLDPSKPAYHLGIYETYWALGHIYNIYTTATTMGAMYIPEVLKVYPDISVTYNSDGTITITSNMTCWVKIKGTWWHKDGLPTFHGSDGYGNWTIALLEPGDNVFCKTLQKPSIEYINAKLLNIASYDGKVELKVNAPKNYGVIIRMRMTWEPHSVYAYYERLPEVVSKSKFDSATFDCWYYDSANKLLYIKVTAHSDVPVQVYYSSLGGDILYPRHTVELVVLVLVVVAGIIGVLVARRKR